MVSIYDLYIKSDIMDTCESFFNSYLEEEGVVDEGLSEAERETVGDQVDHILDMITRIHKQNPGDDGKSADEVVDKLIGYVVVAKMNEVRLCRLLNRFIDGEG